MRYSVTLKRVKSAKPAGEAGPPTIRYADAYGGRAGMFAEPIVLRGEALPTPIPDVIRMTLDWPDPARPAKIADRGAAQAATAAQSDEVAAGDHVRIIKSRVSGVKYPPEWLEQYVGKSGVVLWTTPDGAMVDLKGEIAWFAYPEIELQG